MSEQGNKALPLSTGPLPQTVGSDTPQPAKRKVSRSQAVPPELARDIIEAAQMVRERHRRAFLDDRKLKDRAARLFRTMLPPRPGRPGRKRIRSVSIAIRLLRTLWRESPEAKPEQIWAKVYPKAIPNYATLNNESRWMEQRQLRDRVHSRKRWLGKRR
jgi:hypothetical protein